MPLILHLVQARRWLVQDLKDLADMAELADAMDLKSIGINRVGSNPTIRTVL